MLGPVDVTQVLGLTLHTVAFVIVWGYYGILARIVLPSLERTVEGPQLGRVLLTIERRAVPLLLLAVALFLATGTYLMLSDPEYEGLGAIRDSWSSLMLLKHLVVVAFVAAGVAVDILVRLADEAEDDATRAAATRRVRRTADVATALGALIALLTAAAQLS